LLIKKIQDNIEELIKTLKILLGEKEIIEGGSINYSESEIIKNYKDHNLGLKKWSIELVNSLK